MLKLYNESESAAAHCLLEEKKKYLLKVDTCSGAQLLVFMFINNLHVHLSLFEEFQTYKTKKTIICYGLCYYDIKSSGTTQYGRPRAMYTTTLRTMTSVNFMELYVCGKNSRTLWNFITGMVERDNYGLNQPGASDPPSLV